MLYKRDCKHIPQVYIIICYLVCVCVCTLLNTMFLTTVDNDKNSQSLQKTQFQICESNNLNRILKMSIESVVQLILSFQMQVRVLILSEPGFNTWFQLLTSQLLLKWNLEGNDNGSSNWVPTTSVKHTSKCILQLVLCIWI